MGAAMLNQTKFSQQPEEILMSMVPAGSKGREFRYLLNPPISGYLQIFMLILLSATLSPLLSKGSLKQVQLGENWLVSVVQETTKAENFRSKLEFP